MWLGILIGLVIGGFIGWHIGHMGKLVEIDEIKRNMEGRI